MTREIKFRAWDGEKMFFYPKWSTLHSKFVLYFSEQIDYVDESDNDNSVVLMQYTGLKDNKGKDVFEGDITDVGVVVWHDEYLGFFLEGEFIEGNYKPLYDNVFVEVIGNIYENPELLNP